MIEPERSRLARRRAHDATDFLHVARQALAVRLAGNADKAVRNVEALCQHAARDKPVDRAVWPAKFIDLRGAFFIGLVAVRHLLEVVARSLECRAQLAAMLNGRAENNGLCRPAEMLMGLADPLSNDIANNADTGSRCAFVAELAKAVQAKLCLFRALGDIHLRLDQMPAIDQGARRDDIDHAVPMLSHTLRKRRCRQANLHGVRMLRHVVQRGLILRVAFVVDDQAGLTRETAVCQRLD